MNRNFCFLLFLFSAFNLKAQTKCGCDAFFETLKKRHSIFGPDHYTAPNYDKKRGQTIVNDYTKLFVHELPIVLIPDDCKSSRFDMMYAVACIKDGQTYYLIFYQEDFMDKLLQYNSAGDLFVLAHEVSHHLLAHTDKDLRTRLKGLPKKGEDPAPAAFLKNLRVHLLNDPALNDHLGEIEADLLALWLVRQKHSLKGSEINNIYDALIKIYKADEERKAGVISLKIRQSVLGQYQNRLVSDAKLIRKYQNKELPELVELVSEEALYMYGLALSNLSKEELQELYQTDLDYRKKLLRRRLSPGLLLGGIAQSIRLESAQYRFQSNFLIGANIRYESQYRKASVSSDIMWNQAEIRNYLDFGNGQQISETLKFGMLRIRPRFEYGIPWNKFRPEQKLRFSVGLSTVLPVQVQYRNYGVSTPEAPVLSTSIHPVIGLSSSLGNRTVQKMFRFGLSYEPQKIRLSLNKNPLNSGTIPSLSLYASFNFF